ncbi:MAG: ribulose 1,5-bisphosphate carboxylase large subunit [Nitrospira sp.]|nr:ribulose 1,5-bisphosphate carboxylase large subunit [Nitrospira sp.]
MADAASFQFSGQRFTVEYRLSGTEAEARTKAALVCNDQTVEAPDKIIPTGMIREQILGRVERFTAATASSLATLSYPVELLGGDCAQLLHVLFGISSLRPGIRVERLEIPEAALRDWPGPRFGRNGLRDLMDIPVRPLVCGVLKPLGLPPAALADLAYQFALGGLDLVKDDQGLADQPFGPFEERVARCAEAVAKANRETGRRCLYLAHVTGRWETMKQRALYAKRAGAGGLLVCPGLAGFDALRDLAMDDAVTLPILSHPALLGSFITQPDSGMAPACVFGQLPRLAGADASLYPIYHAGFPVTRDDCRAIAKACGEAWGGLKPIFPTAAGRMGFERVLEMCEFYGQDLLFIVGSSIQQHRAGLVKACRLFMDEVARSAQ